jgi:hypothetical protein
MPEPFHGEPTMTVYRLLQRLLQSSRASVPAVMLRRTIGSFTLQYDAPPQAAASQRYVLVYPQNPFVGEPEVRRMYVDEAEPGLVNARLQVQDSRGVVAQPDADGHYLFPPGTPEFDQVNAFYFATFTLRMWERYAQRSLPWAFASSRLTIDPHVGEKANAFYSEQACLLGFHAFAGKNGEATSTARSADIVSHETGHAILDGIRGLYNESFSVGCRAFHESFADITAMLVALHDDSLVMRLLESTQGNLRRSNFVSEVAEHLIEHLKNGNDRMLAKGIYLRNAFNQFKDVPLDTLDYLPPNPEFTLSRQEHNYSRLFTGTCYDILVGIYEQLKQTMLPVIALYRAREAIGKLLITAIEMGPVGEIVFKDMARLLLSADMLLFNGQYQTVLKTVFAQRHLLLLEESAAYLASIQALPDVRLPSMLNNTTAASEFLKNTVLPALNLTIPQELFPMNAYRNGRGHVFITYFQPDHLSLQGTEYGDYANFNIDLFGGLTLTFDAANRLRTVCYRPVTAEDKQHIGISIADMVKHDRVTTEVHPLNIVPEPHPSGLLLTEATDTANTGILMKYPVIFDDVPEQIAGFTRYLQSWEEDGFLPGEDGI